MMKTVAYVFGVFFVVIGILGFLPVVSPGGMLLGHFHVNALHNLIHLVTGIVAIWAGSAGAGMPKLFFRVVGVIYVLVAVLGFWYGPLAIFGVIANNFPDAVLHTVAGVLALWLGFGCCCKECCKKE